MHGGKKGREAFEVELGDRRGGGNGSRTCARVRGPERGVFPLGSGSGGRKEINWEGKSR